MKSDLRLRSIEQIICGKNKAIKNAPNEHSERKSYL